MRVVVLRYGHRVGRDKRVTTHVALVARAFGAEGIYVHGDADESVTDSVLRVVNAWGGPFWLKWVSDYVPTIKQWKEEGGALVHLTMYGQDLDDVLSDVSSRESVMVFVGSSKVPAEVYHMADYNVAVGHQPHSEVAALAVFLDRLFRGEELKKRFNGARLIVLPSKDGKIVLEARSKGGAEGEARG